MQRQPRLAGLPFIVGDAEQPKRVVDRSEEAASLGVRRGMTVRQAFSQHPGIVIIPPDPVLYRGRWESVLEALENLSPEVEDREKGCACLNISGLARHYRDDDDLAAHIVDLVQEASGLAASVGIAEGKFTAFAAATCTASVDARVVLVGNEATFLKPLSVDLLPIGAEIIARLRLLGLEQIGEVAALSVPELQSQFGFAGKRLWQLTNGIDEEPLRPRRRVESLDARLTFEAPVAGIDVIVAAAKQLLSRLRLPLRGRAVRELTLQAELTTNRDWERRLVLREAVSETDRLTFLLRSTLQNAPPPMAVSSLSLRLSKLAADAGKQLYMGERGHLEQQLEEATRQLRARYGYSPIYRCVDVEPWSVIPEERQLLVESDA